MNNEKGLPNAAGVFLERSLLASFAFWQLNGSDIRVLMIFYLKRKISKKKHEKRSDTTIIVNNGQIVFTYKEAVNKYRISKSTFERSLKRLLDLGFIRVNEPCGPHKPVKYEIIESWKLFGTDDFKINPKPKSKMTIGKDFRFKGENDK